ncbi:leucine zipper protein 4 [Peromyscus californicus insignis]|uniref:leucine zipper protein 4 n=1 Tax=Peromyscus californicus insignis TaxID=564181 RepID=UPI0022A6B806|nr:leucine zipper protein 4 [Peromyscus californicus insignis]
MFVLERDKGLPLDREATDVAQPKMAVYEDEIGLHRHLESSDTEEEYHEENDIQRPSSRERTITPMHHWGRGFRGGHRGRNGNFFGQRLSENQPSHHLMRHDNSEDRSEWNGNQSEERQLQIEGNQVSFRRVHGHSQSRGRHIIRSHGPHSRRSHSHFRRAPVYSDRSHLHHGHPDRPHHDHPDRPHYDHSDRPHHVYSDRPHHDHSGRLHYDHPDRPDLDHPDRPHHDHPDRLHHDHTDRPHRDYSGRPHHDYLGRSYHDHPDRPHHDYPDRPHHDHPERPHHDHPDRPHYDHPGRPHYDHPGRPHHDHPGRPHHDHPGRLHHDHPGRPHHDHPGRPHHDHPGRPHHDHPGRPHHDHPGRPHHDHPGRPHHDHPGRPHHDHPDRPHHDHSGELMMAMEGELITTIHGDLAVMKRDIVVKQKDLEESNHHQNLNLKLTGKSKISTLSIFSTIRETTEYLLAQEQQRNELINLNGEVKEGYSSSEESDESSDSLWRPEVDAEFLNGRYTTIKTITRFPKGVRLNFNVAARTNRTNLSLHTRFTILRTLRRARMNNVNNRPRRQED